MNCVIANHGSPMQIHFRIQRITLIEIKKAILHVKTAEWQSGFDVFHADLAFQSRMQTSSAKMQINNGIAGGQTSTNREWVFGLDRDVEFPVAERGIRNRKLR